MCEVVLQCPQVKTGDKKRNSYSSLEEAVRDAAKMNEKYPKFTQVRYCPTCGMWHLTTHGTGVPGVKFEDADKVEVFVGIFPGTSEQEKSSIINEAKELVEELKFVNSIKPLLGGNNLKISMSTYLLDIATGGMPLMGIGAETRYEIISYSVNELSRRVFLKKEKALELIEKLSKIPTQDRKARGNVIKEVGKAIGSLYYIDPIFPELRKELEAELAKYK